MQIEEARKLTDEALQRLGQALQQGHSDTLKAYLAAMGRFHRYSLRNAMLIVAQRPHARQVAGFHTWKKLGRRVRRGERGISILAPVVRRKVESKTDPADEPGGDHEAPESAEPAEEVVSYRGAYVFDVAQTEGRPLPEFARPEGDPGAFLDRLKAFVRQRGIELSVAEDLGGAEGMSTGGRILIRAGLAPADEFATIAHECAHELLHRDQRQPSGDRSVRELEAEAVACAVCAGIGLEPSSSSADYIQLYQGDARRLAASLERIQQAATEILAGNAAAGSAVACWIGPGDIAHHAAAGFDQARISRPLNGDDAAIAYSQDEAGSRWAPR